MTFSVRALAIEFIGTALFIFMATGTAVGTAVTPEELLGGTVTYNKAAAVMNTAAAFGFSIAALVYAFPGAQVNPAVTLALVLVRGGNMLQGVCNVVMQVLGAILGSAIVLGMHPSSLVGSNMLASAKGHNLAMPFLAEAVATFCLAMVVLQCCCSSRRRSPDGAPLAIGLAVFVAHLTLIPYTSCSINPARSLAPAIVTGTWPAEFWIFVLGPLTGGAVASCVHIGLEHRRPETV